MSIEPESPPAPPLPTIRVSERRAALAGAVAGGLAVAMGMLVAAITSVVSPIDAVGSEVIDRAPTAVRKWAIDTFGTADKLVLRIGIVTLLALGAIALGVATRTRRSVGAVGVLLFGAVGALAAANRPGESVGAIVPSIVGAIIGAAAIVKLAAPRTIEVPGGTLTTDAAARRRLLIAAGGTAVVAGVGARVIDNRQLDDFAQLSQTPLPVPTEIDSAPTLPGAIAEQETSLSPFITPNDDFYRIDTALRIPRITTDEWSLTIEGMVDRPTTISWNDLMAMPQVERIITIACVSNEIGGDLVGNALWRGVLLRDLLEPVGIQDGAQQILSGSDDGWTCGFPVGAAFDGRDAMLAFGMNGDPLPPQHGFPARLIVPGLYGYVSATKWLRRIELTTWDRRGYWIDRGWSLEAPIKTQSRIDVPRTGASLAPGKVRVAGVAWAPTLGIDSVQVSVDGGDWIDTSLSDDVSDDAWRQWWVDLDLDAGDYLIAVRATDGTGYTQTDERTAVAPDGATGHHMRRLRVG